MRSLSVFIFYKVLGWKLEGEFSTELKKFVIAVVPHTSWHDFYMGLLIRKIIRLQINFLGKKELFDSPFGWYFRKVGGIALDRTGGQNKVEAIANEFKKRDEMRLALAPEGTRKRVKELKTGFYYIAKEANVPIVLLRFDFGKKIAKVGEPLYPTDDMQKDFEKIHDFFRGAIGKIPEYSFIPEEND